MEACKLSNPAAGKVDCFNSAPQLAGQCRSIDVSIIICTRNRAEALRGCLESVSQAVLNNPSVQPEILIVDNGSTDHTRDVISTWASSVPCPVLLVEEPRPGLGGARNSGIRHTTGRLIAFTDDDCRLGPNYLSDLMIHFQNDIVPVIRGGRVELGNAGDLPLGIKVDDTEAVLRYPVHPGSIALGCNMVVNRQVFTRIGLFDERFGAGAPFKAGEETEFFYRAYLHEVPVIYVPNMTVYHFHGRQSLDVARKQYSGYFVGNGAMYAKYMFAEGGLIKHLYWDMRKTLLPARHGQRLNEEPLVSRPYMMLQLLRGMMLYWAASVAELLHREKVRSAPVGTET
jgi:glycosyltransferase involved in cell wall biosynthesis